MDFNEIKQELKENNLALAFPAIRQKAASVGNWEVEEQVERLWTTYQQMIQFMLNGVKDAQSGQIREKICRDLQFATARLERFERLKNNASEKYVSSRKELKNVPSFEYLVNLIESISTEITQLNQDELMRDSIRQHRMEQLEKDHEAALLQLFNWTWTSEVWQNGDVDQANRLIFSDHISSFDKAVFVSAVTLSLLEFIDLAKIFFLLDCYLVEDVQISQRALVGFVLVTYLFYGQFDDSKELRDRLAIYREDPAFVHDTYATMMQLQLCCTTDQVTSKMRDDIIPTLMRGQMLKRVHLEDSVDLDVFIKNGENPEWVAQANVDKKLRELANLQLDGADIYYSSFAMLKGHSFFGQMPHWFYPFSFNDILVPEIKQVLSGKIGRLMKLMLGGAPFCNSDKYSLCFTFNSLGSMGEAAVEAQINQQLDGENIDELIDDAEKKQPQKSDIRRQYIFDLYRFFYSYPYKLQFYNPFESLKKSPVTPFRNSLFAQTLTDSNEDIMQYADFLMHKTFYGSALFLFETLDKNEFEEKYASLWQKIGFCHQKLSQTENAIKAYHVANTLKPNSKWTLSHLASLYFNGDLYEEAAACYADLIAIEPENQRYLLHASQALIRTDRHEDAQQYLYKALYLDEDSMQVKLLLSWCLIVNGQKDKAAKYILEIQSEDPQNEEAQVLFALILLVDGNAHEAYHRLKSILTDENKMDVEDKLRTLVYHKMIDDTTEILFTDALMFNID